MPFAPGVFPVLVLPLAMLDYQGEQLVGQGDATATGRRLHLDLDQAAAVALWAPAGVAGAVRPAGRWAFPLMPLAVLRARLDLVVTAAAGMRIGAAALPG